MDSMKREFLETTGYAEKGWTTDGLGVLICPHGYRVEDDGGCAEGCDSPMVSMAII